MGDLLSPIVDKVFEYVVRPGSKQVAYILHYKENVDELICNVEYLGREKEILEHQVDDADKNLRKIEAKVKEWLREVDEFVSKFENFMKDEGHTKSRFPHLWNRHRLSRRATKMAMEVKKLRDETPMPHEVAYTENVTSNDVTSSNVGYMDFGSRKSLMNEILASLQDPTIRMIGLHGPGGVGKSTFVKEISNIARNKKMFNVVAIAEITANPNLQKIQEEIAYVLGLRLEGNGENVRADCIRRRLKKEKDNTLIILDDIWDKLDLNKLGIPLDDEDNDYDYDLSGRNVTKGKKNINEKGNETNGKKNENEINHSCKVMKTEKSFGDYKRCKILLTSRVEKVLSDKMDVKSIFRIKELDDKDALMLFQKTAGISNEMPNFKQEIVKKYCGGIPVAIITVGRALRAKSDSVWEAKLEKLKKQELVGVQEPMEISLKMSYDHLESEELKSIFLLCAQMGHQPLTMDLVKYSYGLGILEGIYSLTEARDRIYTSLKKLKGSSLVLDGSSINHFNMHDMVRDTALSIAHKEKNIFTRTNGKLDDWPELEKCTSISICNSDILDKLPNVINCPQLNFFQIDNDDSSLRIPNGIFKRMKKLKVLILNGFHLSNLQYLIKGLSNLRMLCLERCNLLGGDLSAIKWLKKLRIVSFSGSEIQNFPTELGCLDKLQLLDISNCSIKEMDQLNFMSKLTSLEELYIRKSSINFSWLSELEHLHQLKVVDLSIPGDTVLSKDLFFDNLNDYRIVIGDIKVLSGGDFRMPNKYEPSKSLALQLKDDTNDIHSQNGIKLLFKTVQNLLLGEINGVKNIIYELNLDGFPDLKHLTITNNFSIKHIFKAKDLAHPLDVFPKLESLCFYKLKNIEMICCSPVTDVSFTKLKTIKVKMCAHLKNIISVYMVKLLSSLEIIEVSDCDSLEEIVKIPANFDMVEFPKLGSLTLQSLPPSFTSFYSRVEGDMTPALFDERVKISNLESLNLSSIDIHTIWCDQSLSSFCFQKLKKLVVKDCNKLRYLCSLSVASGLSMLKSLYVSGCHAMEKIFCTKGNGLDKVFVFPKLEEIHLNKMKMLTDIWQTEMSVDSFCSLISVHIEECEKLDRIFSSHMEGWYASLEKLKVVNCRVVKVIFEIKDSQQRDASGGIDTNLQSIFLYRLPKLKQVWSTDPRGILNFRKLHNIDVSSCDKLRNVFPASMAKDVQNIEYMSVGSCKRMVEIIACEDGLEASNEPLVFPKLTSMEFCWLQNMERFYKGRHGIKCPKMKRLTVVYCKKLETFQIERSESTNEEVAVFSTPKELFLNLEYLDVDFDQAEKWLLSNTKMYRMHRLKELIIHGKVSLDSLYQFLYRMPNLEKLSLHKLMPSANIAPQERLGTVLQLKELVLSYTFTEDIGLERHPFLRRLELLTLQRCHNLSILAPPSVSLTYLTYLEVKSCHGLRNLMASSMAKSLVQLKTMKVIDCNEIKEIIISYEGNEKENIEIVFSNLITIELVTLKHLTSFCSNENCKFKFPLLEILIVRECPNMKTFSEKLASAPKLQNNILAVEGEEEAKWQWESDLNGIIQKVSNDKVSFRYSEHLNLSSDPEFMELFGNLKILRAYNCNSLEHVIPSHLLPCFENLEELEVLSCSEARVIFNISDEKKALGIIRLKRLTLDDLPKLEHVWDKDPEGIIHLQVLRFMWVTRCDSLKSLFPAGVAKKDVTRRLEELDVRECRELVEIFSKGAEAEGATKTFVFSSLTSLTLTQLPKLKYFYPGLHTLEWPVLQKLDAFDCELVKLKCEEDDAEEQVLIEIEKVIQIPSLKKLSFSNGHIKVTWDRESVGGQLQFDKLKDFEELLDSAPLYRFLHMFPNSIQKFAFSECQFAEMFSAKRSNADYSPILLHLKGLELSYMDELKSIGLEHSCLQPFLENLQTLQVNNCWNLSNLVPSACTVSFTNLTYLEVGNCRNLSNLVPSACTVSFPNLTYLEVSSCEGLIYLFTSSTAKSLGRLRRLKIEKCKSLIEIVSSEGNESDEDEQIIFEQLQVLYLKELRVLRWFYPGNYTLRFPCLEQVHVIDCWWMKTFSPNSRIYHSTTTKWFSAEYEKPQQCSDLNSTAHRIFEEKLCNLEDLEVVGDKWKMIWLGGKLFLHKLKALSFKSCETDVFPCEFLQHVPNIERLEVRESSFNHILCFQSHNEDDIGLENSWIQPILRNLTVLKIFHCNSLRCLLTSSTAKSLAQLKTMEIERCDSIEEIVVCNKEGDKSNEDEIIFPKLKSLNLEELSKLKSFYRGSLSLPSLDQLKVKFCNKMKYLFTSSTAKSLAQLKTMEIEDCDSIEEIVVCNKEGDESNEDEIIFSKLDSLKLIWLLKLRRFYRGSLSFPSLDQLEVIHCYRMKTFCAGTVKADKLSQVQFDWDEDPIPVKNDLNSTMREVFRYYAEMEGILN